MHVPAGSRPAPLGFLTVVSDATLGAVGGYLITNRSGRPLEFHCTAPVRATRAQEILYGHSLEPYLYGELIGQALLAKAATTPGVVCTDCAAVMSAREFVETPLALLAEGETPTLAAAKPFVVGGGQWLAVSPWHPQDQSRIEALLHDGREVLDLWEPFERIREAIREAQRSAA